MEFTVRGETVSLLLQRNAVSHINLSLASSCQWALSKKIPFLHYTIFRIWA